MLNWPSRYCILYLHAQASYSNFAVKAVPKCAVNSDTELQVTSSDVSEEEDNDDVSDSSDEDE